jgi:hypothetical protein
MESQLTLSRAGCRAGGARTPLIELAIAFVINHPAVTAAIIGPRTIEQLESQLPAAEVTLTADLDRIDQLVAPGVTINPDDNSYGEAELTPEANREGEAASDLARHKGKL